MQTNQLTQELYQAYKNISYFFTILFQKDVVTKLNEDYNAGIMNEDYLLNLLDSLIMSQPCILGFNAIISNNLSKIIANLPSKYLEIVNRLKLAINLNKDVVDYKTFLTSQYLCRRYGIASFSKLNLMQKIAFSKLYISPNNHEFSQKVEDKVYESFEFDFNLIFALNTLPNNAELFNKCINNHNFLSSINYFKCHYPVILNDEMFLYFTLNVLEFNKKNLQCNEHYSNIFGDFDSQNESVLKYIKQKVKINVK